MKEIIEKKLLKCYDGYVIVEKVFPDWEDMERHLDTSSVGGHISPLQTFRGLRC